MPPALPPTPAAAPTSSAPGTLFPHLLIDEVMPALSGSEWALLCVVVRQTLGWHDPATGGRKSSDWLSHRQLRARTGRGSDAVCSAVDSLVRRDLIEIRDEAGRLLPTPVERRRARRLFYALSPRLLDRTWEAGQVERELSAFREAPAPAVPESRTSAPPAVRPSRSRITETTKETRTKYKESSFGKAESRAAADGQAAFRPARPQGDGCGCLRPPTPPPPRPSRPEPPDPQTLAFLRFYRDALSHRHAGRHETGELDGEGQARLQTAFGRHGPERLERMAEDFLGSDSALLHYGGYGIGAFLEVLPTLAVLRPKPPSATRTQGLGAGHVAAGLTVQHEE